MEEFFQLRDYRVKPGEMQDWLKEWREKIYPLRLKYGFRVVGAWVKDEEDRFVWILSYVGGEHGFEDSEKQYFNSPERKSMSPDPIRHLASATQSMIRSVL
jgi:hypothetical protein